MYDILSELRVYAAMNGMHRLAEELDDTLLVLRTEARRAGAKNGAGHAATRRS